MNSSDLKWQQDFQRYGASFRLSATAELLLPTNTGLKVFVHYHITDDKVKYGACGWADTFFDRPTASKGLDACPFSQAPAHYNKQTITYQELMVSCFCAYRPITPIKG